MTTHAAEALLPGHLHSLTAGAGPKGENEVALAELILEAASSCEGLSSRRGLRYLCDEWRRLDDGAKSAVVTAAVPGLARLLQESSREQRLMSAITLRELGPAARAAQPALIQSLPGADSPVAEAILRALLAQDPEPAVAVSVLVRCLQRKPSRGTRQLAIDALKQLGEHAEPAIPELLNILKYRRLRIRFAAADALIAIGPAGVRALANAAHTAKCSAVQHNAALSLRTLEEGWLGHEQPIRSRFRIERAWLLWNDCTVPRLAKTAKRGSRPGVAAILADALLDAGCNEEFLLSHLRLPMEHGPDCFAIRAILAAARPTSYAALFHEAGAGSWYDLLLPHEQQEADGLADEWAEPTFATTFSRLKSRDRCRLVRLIQRQFVA